MDWLTQWIFLHEDLVVQELCGFLRRHIGQRESVWIFARGTFVFVGNRPKILPNVSTLIHLKRRSFIWEFWDRFRAENRLVKIGGFAYIKHPGCSKARD